jgi:DNA-binding response OmpR family regulator
VLILSARGEEWDKVKGFRLGADDYMVKPFSLMELLERIRAIFRRSRPHEMRSVVIRFSALELDLLNRTVRINKGKVSLPGRQFELLAYFMRNPGRVISRKELLENVWFSSPEISTRTVDVHIAALRKAMPQEQVQIETVYKAGYRLTA